MTQFCVKWSKLSLGSLLVACVLLLNAMAASPDLHKLIHNDAGQSDHQCVVTLFAHGQVNSATVEVVALIPVSPVDFFPLASLSVFRAPVETLPPGRGPPVSLLHL